MRTSLVGKHGHTSGEPTAWSQGLCADPLRGETEPQASTPAPLRAPAD